MARQSIQLRHGRVWRTIIKTSHTEVAYHRVTRYTSTLNRYDLTFHPTARFARKA